MKNEFANNLSEVVLPRKWEMLVLDACKGHFIARNKSYHYQQFHKHRPHGQIWDYNLTTAGTSCCGEQTIQEPSKAALQ
jgi:hypothetical protein